MNIYVVVEGEVGEKQVYREWIPCVNPHLSFVASVEQVTEDNFFIIHGGGYPRYFSVIESAIDDVLNISNDGINRLFSRLVISADSEENTYEEKKEELESFVNTLLQAHKISNFDYKTIVQNFCLEAWGLGNRKVISKSSKSEELRRFTKDHDVSKFDPELLRPFGNELLTRAQYAEKYLRAALLNKHKNLTYTKRNPEALLSKKYFDQLESRLIDTRHIRSFQDFLDAFK